MRPVRPTAGDRGDAGSARFEVLLEIEGVQVWQASGVLQWDGDQVDADLSLVGHEFRVPLAELVLVGDEAYLTGEWLEEFGLVVPRGRWVSVSKEDDAAPAGLWREVEAQVWLGHPVTVLSILALTGEPRPVSVERLRGDELLRYWGTVEVQALANGPEVSDWLLDPAFLVDQGVTELTYGLVVDRDNAVRTFEVDAEVDGFTVWVTATYSGWGNPMSIRAPQDSVDWTEALR